MHLLAAYNPADVKPGLIGFLVVAVLGFATFLLVRSMNKQMRKIKFDEGDQDTGSAPGGHDADAVAPNHRTDSAPAGESHSGEGTSADR